jgi:MFS family permease
LYISVRNIPVNAPRTASRVSRIVLILGCVSLLTDISTEMVTAVMPLFVTVGLGLSAMAFGVLDSVYQAGSAIARIAGGYSADRLRRPKAVAVVGYGLGAAAKLLLLPAAGVAALSGALGVDRIGKGLRTGPRDALIAGASAPESLGRSFGVHRALDTLGALLGPVVAFYLLLAAPDDFHTVFLVSLCFAGLGVLLLVSKVPEDRPARSDQRPHVTVRAALRLIVSRPEVRRMVVAALGLSALTVSDAFLYLSLLERGAISSRIFPLLFLATSLVYLCGAIPFGEFADRHGRIRVFIVGHVMIVVAYLVASAAGGPATASVALALLGFYYAATDGVLPAATATFVDPEWRATAISTLQTCVAVGRSAAALMFGALWALTDPATSLCVFAGGLAVVLLLVAPGLLRKAG